VQANQFTSGGALIVREAWSLASNPNDVPTAGREELGASGAKLLLVGPITDYPESARAEGLQKTIVTAINGDDLRNQSPPPGAGARGPRETWEDTETEPDGGRQIQLG